jgi:hypothetical protein
MVVLVVGDDSDGDELLVLVKEKIDARLGRFFFLLSAWFCHWWF